MNNIDINELFEKIGRLLEMGDFNKADEICLSLIRKGYDIPEIYLVRLLAQSKSKDLKDLKNSERPLDELSSYKDVIETNNDDIVDYVMKCNKTIRHKIAESRESKNFSSPKYLELDINEQDADEYDIEDDDIEDDDFEINKTGIIIGIIIAVVIVIGVLIIVFIRKDSNNATTIDGDSKIENTANDGEVNSEDCARVAYASLGALADGCDYLSETVGSIWEWTVTGIDEKRMYAQSNVGQWLCMEMSKKIKDSSITMFDIQEAYNQVIGFESEAIMLKDASYAVPTTIQVFKNTGLLDQMDSLLGDSKELIKKVSEKENYYSDLKAYYTAVENYYNFCTNPSGNLRDYPSTISAYQQEIATLRGKLSFDLE